MALEAGGDKMAGRRLTGARRFDQGQLNRNFVDPARVPLNQGFTELPAQEIPLDMGMPQQMAQPLPEAGQGIPDRFFVVEREGQTPILTNIPQPGARELPAREAGQLIGVSEEAPTFAEPIEDVRARAEETFAAQEAAPPSGTALEQSRDLFNQLQEAGVANEFQAAMKETGLDQKIKLEEQIRESSPEAEGISEVQSAKILPGGAGAEIVRKDGTLELVTLKEAEAALIKEVEKHDAAIQGLRAGERDAAKLAINKSKEAFEKMTLTQENIAAMGDAIAEIDAGAKAGFIESRLPSIRASSIRLENIQKQLGLNVIGGVTFGALSKGELDLALSKALPTGLNEGDLRDWLVDKKEAQEKLVDNLQDAAIFLGTPGNTVANFLARNKEQAQPVTEAGGDLTPAEQAELEELRRRFR